MLVGGLVALLFLTFISLTQGLADISVNTVVQALVSPQDIADHHLIRACAFRVRSWACWLAPPGGVGRAYADRHAQPAGLGDDAWRKCRRLFGRRGGDDLLAGTASVCPSTGSGRRNAGGCRRLCAGGKTQGSPLRIALSGMIVTLVLSSVTSALVR